MSLVSNTAGLQGLCGGAYLGAGLGLLRGTPVRKAVLLLVPAAVAHSGLVLARWAATGQLPLVSRYEDLTVDALTAVLLYLVLQWRHPALDRPAAPVLLFAGLLTLAALAHERGTYPLSPALESGWLLVHAQLNSLAVATATVAASLGIMWRGEVNGLAWRLLEWSLLLWSAMVVAGAWWADLAWGRFWGWDPIESWSLGTLLAYAFVLHLGRSGKWGGRRGLRLALVPYGLLLFTTYGLLVVMHSVHGRYLFQ